MATSESPIVNFYQQTITLEFVAGILLCRIFMWKPEILMDHHVFFLLLFAVAVIMKSHVPAIPGHVSVTMATTSLVAASLSMQHVKQQWLLLLAVGGEISYSIYLSHPFIIRIFGKISEKLDSLPVALAGSLVAIFTCILVSLWLYRLVEVPAQNFLRQLFSRKPGGISCRTCSSGSRRAP